MTRPKLVAVGDVSFGDNYVCASIGVNKSLRRQPDFDLFSEVREYIHSGDLRFVNLETVISEKGLDRRNLHSMHLRGHPDDVKRLVSAGFNVINIANNHMMQHGVEAFEETVELLRSNNLGVVGLAQSNGLNCVPYETKLGDTDVVFLGYGFEKDLYYKGTTLYAQGVEANVLDDIRACKTESNIVICSFHWGKEFISYPSIDQVSLGRKAIEQGCDLILGHHPHVLNGFETWNDRLIFYSLGNFVFDQLWNPLCTEGCIVKLAFDGRFHVEELQLTQYAQTFAPELRGGNAEAEERFDELSEILRATIKDKGVQYAVQRANLERKNRHASWFHMLKNIWRYDPRILRQIIGDTISKKVGLK